MIIEPGQYVYTTEPPFDRPSLGARMVGVFRSTFTVGDEEFGFIESAGVGGFCAKMADIVATGRSEPKFTPRIDYKSAYHETASALRIARAALFAILAINLAIGGLEAAHHLGWIR